MTAEGDQLSYADVLARISELADGLLANGDPDVREQVTELLDWVDAFHRDGLGRMVEMIRAWRGEIFLEALAEEDVTSLLLAAYGLGEDRDIVQVANDAVAKALEEVRPLVESHGGSIEVESVVDGVVRVRMLGTCDGCPSSSATLTYGVEAALRTHWSQFRRLELVDPPSEVDPAKEDLTCVTVPGARAPASPPPAPATLLQIRGYEGR